MRLFSVASQKENDMFVDMHVLMQFVWNEEVS